MSDTNEKKHAGFIDMESVPAFEPAPGCQLKTPYGEKLMLSQVSMKKGAEIPLHNHFHEQGGVVISGRLELQIGDETRVLESGEVYLIPANVPHRAIAVDGPVVVIDFFAPIREDYIELSEAANTTSD